MKKNRVLILGDGMLGTNLQHQSGWEILSRRESGFDITDKETYHLMTKVEFGAIQYCDYDVIVNTIACTDTYASDKSLHWSVNYKGVSDLVDFCNRWKIKLVHIVTDYIYANSKPGATEEDVPVHCRNWYGYTKLLGDAHVQLKSNNYLLIRSTHKPEPFKYDKAWVNQIGNFDYVSKISKLMIDLIEKDGQGIYNLGTEVKTMYELAKRTKSNVEPEFKLLDNTTPDNLVMDVTKLNKKLKGVK